MGTDVPASTLDLPRTHPSVSAQGSGWAARLHPRCPERPGPPAGSDPRGRGRAGDGGRARRRWMKLPAPPARLVIVDPLRDLGLGDQPRPSPALGPVTELLVKDDAVLVHTPVVRVVEVGDEPRAEHYPAAAEPRRIDAPERRRAPAGPAAEAAAAPGP